MWAEASQLHTSSPCPDAGALATPLSALASVLPALGPVLCLYRRDLLRPEESRHWLGLCAAPARAFCEVSSDGPREALRFCDRAGRPLLQACLLCDSDFLGWERAMEACGVQRDPSPGPLCQLPWLARLRWRARLLRFVPPLASAPALDAGRVSAAGQRMAADWCRRYGCANGER